MYCVYCEYNFIKCFVYSVCIVCIVSTMLSSVLCMVYVGLCLEGPDLAFSVLLRVLSLKVCFRSEFSIVVLVHSDRIYERP